MSAFEVYPRRSADRPVLARLLLVVGCMAMGCAGLEHAYTANEYAGRLLSVTSPPGAERLRMEIAHDPAVADFVAREGQPGSVYVLDRNMLYLFYNARDRVAIFRRDLFEASKVIVYDKIPGSLLTLLPKREQQRLLAKRKRASSRARAKAPPRRRVVARSGAPAAPNRSLRLSRFDVNEIVAVLRRPMTAADAGVTAWRRSLLPDGSLRRTGESGSTRYEVQGDRVTAAVPITGGGRRHPMSLRLAVTRVNHAVFGVRAALADSIGQDLALRVARDATGRTAFTRRIAGRTLRVTRSGDRKQVLYSVRAD